MNERTRTRKIGLAFAKAAPDSVEAGTTFPVSLQPEWPEDVPRTGATFTLRAGEKGLHDGPLPEQNSDGSIDLTLPAPAEVGEHRLALVVTSAPGGDEASAEGTLPFMLRTIPHATSLAVWDVPSPLVRNAAFEIRAGAKCSASCGLAGKVIEIRDEENNVMGSGVLGDAVLPGTTALYFATIPLKAPSALALHGWSASFAPSELKLPHGSATSRFTFVTVAEPEHSVSVKVVNKETKAPLEGAHVSLGVHRAVTDATGSARLDVPKGTFKLIVTRAGYAMPERKLDVAKDVRVRITAEKLPERDPFALWSD